MLIGRILPVELLDPLLQLGQYLIGIAASQFPAAPVSASVLRKFEVVQQSFNRGTCYLSGFDQGTGRIGDAINAPVDVIAIRVPGIVLHMADQNIVPVDQVKRTVRSKFHIHWPEVRIISRNQILAMFTLKTGFGSLHSMLLGSQKSNGVIDQKVSLNFIRKVAAGYEFQARSGAHLMSFFN